MKSLENIYVERTTTHLERGVNGIAKQVSRTFKHKVTVRTLTGGLRIVHLIADQIAVYIVLLGIMFFTFFTPYSHFYDVIANLLFLLIFPAYYTLMEYKF